MTIDRAIAMLNGIDQNVVREASESVMGRSVDIYTFHLNKEGYGVVKKYHPTNASDIWEMLGGRHAAHGVAMKFTGLLKGGEGERGKMHESLRDAETSPAGGSWEEWWEMKPEQRLASLDLGTIEDWIDLGFKDLTYADESIVRNQGKPGLAKRIHSIIHGTRKNKPMPEQFASDSTDSHLASFAGVYDQKPGADFNKLINEIKAAWVHFMVNDPAGVVKMLTKALQDAVNIRISSA